MPDNIININRDEVFSVKIYFINPIELLDVVINTLLEMEYETYQLDDPDKYKLLKIVPNDIRNIIYFCLRNKLEVPKWLEFVEDVKKIEGTHNLLGCFYFDHLDNGSIRQFLQENVAMISFSDVKTNPLLMMKKVLQYFEAKGKRRYIRVLATGISEAYFYTKDKNEPIIGKIIDISRQAFSCRIPEENRIDIKVNQFYKNTLLILKGARIKVDVKVIGFSKDDPGLYVFKFCNVELKAGKVIFTETVPSDVLYKVHSYIKECLKENMRQQIDSVKDDFEEKKKKKNAPEA